MPGEITRVTGKTVTWCPGFLCVYSGGKALQRRFAWNGSSRGWHMGALYQDILRRE